MNNEPGEEVILNTPEDKVIIEEIIDDEPEESAEEDFDWKAEALKQREIAENQKIRAEKAEKRKPEVRGTKEELSTLDIIALSKANIDNEDIEEVLDYAKFKKISVAEALKSQVIKASLAEKNEIRTSALASNTGTSRRGNSNVSDDQLLANARKGVMPESDADIQRLIVLRRERK